MHLLAPTEFQGWQGRTHSGNVATLSCHQNKTNKEAKNKQNKQTKKQKTNKTNKHQNKQAKQTEFQGWQGRTHGSLFAHCTHTSIETNKQTNTVPRVARKGKQTKKDGKVGAQLHVSTHNVSQEMSFIRLLSGQR